MMLVADINKIGLLVLSDDSKKFLACEKSRGTTDFILPGGKIEDESDEECLVREVNEELGCEVDISSLKFIGSFEDVAAGDLDKTLLIRLYSGKLIGKPVASSEIKALHLLGKEDSTNLRVSPITRNKIIPYLVAKKILL